MKYALQLIILIAASASVAKAGDVNVEAVMVTEPGGREITTYVNDAPKLYSTFKTKGAKNGDKVRGVWIADDVGEAAPAGTKIDEKTITLDGDTDDGIFSLSKPTKGWPAGKYHLELYVNDQLTTKVTFEIKAAAKSKKSTEKEEEESGD